MLADRQRVGRVLLLAGRPLPPEEPPIAHRLKRFYRQVLWGVEKSPRLVLGGVAVVLLFGTFLFLYRFVPAAPTRLRGIWPGALAAAAGFEAVQYGFSLYLTYFGHYNKIYGSLGAIVAFLFFIYLASSVFLFGAEIAAEYPRLRAGPGRAPPSDSPCQGSGAGNGAGHSRAAGLRN